MLSTPTLLLAALAAFHSFVPTSAEPDSTITAAPARRTPSDAQLADLAARQAGSSSPLPLTDYHYSAVSDIPYQVNPYAVGRGPQSGYNICNSTTAGPDSLCQTMWINNISDFCLWSSPIPNETIGDVEAQVVAWCSQDGHGTRVMPEGTITGLQFMQTSAYMQVVGYINQANVDLQASDYGGELDPHGADLLGNPLGGLVWSMNMSGSAGTATQVWNWNEFIGSGMFCFKACYNSVTSPDYCQNIFDLVGCDVNMPANYNGINGTYTSCEGDLQEPVGTYVGTDGQTTTWSQPASLTPGFTLPWTPIVPASSNCVTYSSAELFGSATTSSTSATATGSGSKPGSGSSGSGSGTRSGSAAGSTSTGGASSASGVVPGMSTGLAGSLLASTALFGVIGALVVFM